ncbi:hypothetical protein HD554DRAFT_381317 [Boletus coccyginus]|nr:hypothetical protein HD554DRAFT_381317 [Boletus coccyginus]
MHWSFTLCEVVLGNAAPQRDDGPVVGPPEVDEPGARRINDRARAPVGPSNMGWWRVLCKTLCDVSNRRQIFVFEEDRAVLTNICSLHGIDAGLMDDLTHCFKWMVNHLFSGAVRAVGMSKRDVLGCTKIRCVLTTATRIVHYAPERVLACSTFYLTDSLREIENVLMPESIGDPSDRKSLLVHLGSYQTSLRSESDCDDAVEMFVQFERLSKGPLLCLCSHSW